jgi:hypothetical protein
MTQNPLKSHFRQPQIFVKFPSQDRWYTESDITNHQKEHGVYAMRAIDDIMLNTPDALLNGHALETIISGCCPDIKNVKNFKSPDLDALYVAIKAATNNGLIELERKCERCSHENLVDLNCQMLLDTMSFVDDSDCFIEMDQQLLIEIQPYDFEMKQLFLQHQFEEEKLIKMTVVESPDDEFLQAARISESVERLSQITFSLVAKSIISIKILETNQVVRDSEFINEWLVNIEKERADQVFDAVKKLNAIGINKNIHFECQNCQHVWEETLEFEPTHFFAKRS